MQDHCDVKVPCHLLLAKLAVAAPQRTLEALPRLTGPLQRSLLAQIKSDASSRHSRNRKRNRCGSRETSAVLDGWCLIGKERGAEKRGGQ